MANLLENWQSRPPRGEANVDRSLSVTESLVVNPGTTQCVSVTWPILDNVKFEELFA